MTRTFTLVSAKFRGRAYTVDAGRYVSQTPVGAAKKAFRIFTHSKRARGPITAGIEVRETTQGSAAKHFFYKVQRKTSTQEPIERGNELVEFRYEIVAHARNGW